jgi:flagellar hook protein FlgE
MGFDTALTGLNGAQTELATISNNIANASTNGFKKSRVSFGDIITASPLQDPSRIIGSGTAVRSVSQQFQQGAIATSDNALDLAISGQGFFAVKGGAGSTQVAFTRNGAFSVTADRYVVDGDGRKLQVFPTTADGSILTNALSATTSLQLPLSSGTPNPTSNIALTVNLPATATVITAPFDANDKSTYNSATSTTIYDSLGNPMAATVYYTKTALPTPGDPLHHWTAHVVVGDTELTQAGVPGVDMSFDSTGALVGPLTPQTYDSFTPQSGGDPMTLTVDQGTATTQVAGPFALVTTTQDGYTTGRLESVAIDGDGAVRVSFTNGEVQTLGKVAVAMFADPSGLKQIGNATYVTTPEAGLPITGEAGKNGIGGILSGSLEKSNVDLTEELVGMITAQRNFQANAKSIETESTLLTTIINMRS